MLKAVFTDQISSLMLNGLTQWDKGRTVEVECSSLPDSFQAHFASWEQPEAMVISCTASDGKATIPIPNILLQSSTDFKMWIYLLEGDTGKTKKQIKFSV